MTFRKTASNLLAAAMTTVDLLLGKSKPLFVRNPLEPTDTPLEPESAIPVRYLSAGGAELFTEDRPGEGILTYCMPGPTIINVATSGSYSASKRDKSWLSRSCHNPCNYPHPDH